jgi:outer membrane protein, multidrug efflux system
VYVYATGRSRPNQNRDRYRNRGKAKDFDPDFDGDFDWDPVALVIMKIARRRVHEVRTIIRYSIHMRILSQRLRWMVAVGAIAAGAAGCMHAPPDPGAAWSDLPERLDAGAPPDAQPELSLPAPLMELLREAVTSNLTLQEARARLDQAWAAAVIAGAARAPALTGEGSAQRDWSSTPTPGTDGVSSFALGLAASYELDLWGRVRNQAAAARGEAEATAADLESAELSVLAAVAEQWAVGRSLSGQRALLDRQRRQREEFLEAIEFRFRRGQATALDVYQQRELIAALAAQQPIIEARARSAELALAALLGRMPPPPAAAAEADWPAPRPLPALGLPAELLAARPDVRAAERRWAAAHAAAGAARADRWPALRLTGRYAYRGDAIEALFDDWFANLAAGLTGPILDGGRRRAEVRRAEAVARERAAGYRRVVLTAVREAEDAIQRDHRRAEEAGRLAEQLDLARQTLREALGRYRSGALDFLNVLTAQIAVDRAEQELLRVRGDWWVDRISLLRALGPASPLRPVPDAPAAAAGAPADPPPAPGAPS